MAEVDSTVAGQPYKRQTKGRKEKNGGASVIKLETLHVRAQNLMDLRIAAALANKEYNDAVTAVAEASGLNAATVSRYIRARCGTNFIEERDRASQMALVFEELGELTEYVPKNQEPDLLTNTPEPNPVEKRSRRQKPHEADPENHANPAESLG